MTFKIWTNSIRIISEAELSSLARKNTQYTYFKRQFKLSFKFVGANEKFVN